MTNSSHTNRLFRSEARGVRSRQHSLRGRSLNYLRTGIQLAHSGSIQEDGAIVAVHGAIVIARVTVRVLARTWLGARVEHLVKQVSA